MALGENYWYHSFHLTCKLSEGIDYVCNYLYVVRILECAREVIFY